MPQAADSFSLSPDGEELILRREGFRSRLYDDLAGHCTIGYGHLVHRGRCNGSEPTEFRKGIDEKRARELFREKVKTFEAAVRSAVTVAITQNQFDALVSLAYNIGVGAFAGSTLLRKLNAGDEDGAADQFGVWNKATVNGKRVAVDGLSFRRGEEARLFRRTGAPAATIGQAGQAASGLADSLAARRGAAHGIGLGVATFAKEIATAHDRQNAAIGKANAEAGGEAVRAAENPSPGSRWAWLGSWAAKIASGVSFGTGIAAKFLAAHGAPLGIGGGVLTLFSVLANRLTKDDPGVAAAKAKSDGETDDFLQDSLGVRLYTVHPWMRDASDAFTALAGGLRIGAVFFPPLAMASLAATGISMLLDPYKLLTPVINIGRGAAWLARKAAQGVGKTPQKIGTGAKRLGRKVVGGVQAVGRGALFLKDTLVSGAKTVGNALVSGKEAATAFLIHNREWIAPSLKRSAEWLEVISLGAGALGAASSLTGVGAFVGLPLMAASPMFMASALAFRSWGNVVQSFGVIDGSVAPDEVLKEAGSIGIDIVTFSVLERIKTAAEGALAAGKRAAGWNYLDAESFQFVKKLNAFSNGLRFQGREIFAPIVQSSELLKRLGFAEKIYRSFDLLANVIDGTVKGSELITPVRQGDDGTLTGPFYPRKDRRYGAVGPQNAPESFVASREAVVFVNGVDTSMAKHHRAAQELADAVGSPVVGVYNATGVNLGDTITNRLRDFGQCVTDKIGMAQRNPAIVTLTDLIVRYGNPDDKKKGGLNLFGHSQGTIIVSEALRQAKKAGTDLRAIDVTTFGNAAFTMPSGLMGEHHYVFDDDAVAASAGSSSLVGAAARIVAPLFGASATANNTTVLHHGGAGIRPHGVIGDDENDKAPSYISSLSAFREAEKNRGGFRQEADRTLLPYRSMAATGGAFLRSLPVVGGVFGGLSNLLFGRGVTGEQQKASGGATAAGVPPPIPSPVPGPTPQSAMPAPGGAMHQPLPFLTPGKIPLPTPGPAPKLQRMGGSGATDFELASRLDPALLRASLLQQEGAGSPVGSDVRKQLEGAVGFDVSGARLHTGPASTQAAASLGAEAFTIGNDVFFGSGMYAPQTAQGRGLLAHELTHVGQQTGARSAGGPQMFSGGAAGGDAMEQEAQNVGRIAALDLARFAQEPEIGSFAVTYDVDDFELSPQDRGRLGSIAKSALQSAKAELMLLALPNAELDTVDAHVEIDLEAMTNDEAVEAWSSALVQAVSARVPRGAASGGVGLQRAPLQRSPVGVQRSAGAALAFEMARTAALAIAGGLLLTAGAGILAAAAGIGLLAMGAMRLPKVFGLIHERVNTGDGDGESVDLASHGWMDTNFGLQRAPQTRIQRSPLDVFMSNGEKVARALQTNDIGDIKAIDDFAAVPYGNRIGMIQILLNQSWVGPRDEWAIEALWRSFGDNLEAESDKNFPAWEMSAKRGASVDDFAFVKQRQEQFKDDVRRRAGSYLSSNKLHVEAEMKKYGLSAEGAAPGPVAEQTESLNKLRKLAATVGKAQEAQRELKRIPVGTQFVPPMSEHDQGQFVTVYFDPASPPEHKPDGTDGEKFGDWAEIKSEYDGVQQVISALTSFSPALYAASVSGDVSALAANDPAAIRAEIARQSRELLANIGKTQGMVDSGALNPLDLFPIHEQMFTGGTPSPSVTSWNRPFNKWASQTAIGDRKDRQFWKQLGLGALSAALFVVAEFATAGAATFALAAGAGTGIGIGMAVDSWDKYLMLSAAQKSATSDQTSLVSNGQVDEALVEAILSSAFALAEGVGAGAKVIGRPARIAATTRAEKLIAELGAEAGTRAACKEAGKTVEELLSSVIFKSEARPALKALQKQLASRAFAEITPAEFRISRALQHKVYESAVATRGRMQALADGILGSKNIAGGEAKSILKRESFDEFVGGVLEKCDRKGYQRVSQMDDLVRGRFNVPTEANVETVQNALRNSGMDVVNLELPRRPVEGGAGFGYPRYHVILRDGASGITHEWQIGTKATTELYEKGGIRIPDTLKPLWHIKNDIHDIEYDVFKAVADKEPKLAEKLGIPAFRNKVAQASARSGKLGDKTDQTQVIKQLHEEASVLLQKLVDAKGPEWVAKYQH